MPEQGALEGGTGCVTNHLRFHRDRRLRLPHAQQVGIDPLEIRFRVPRADPERVERPRTRDHFRILLRIGGGRARGDPVRKTLAGRIVRVLRCSECKLRTFTLADPCALRQPQRVLPYIEHGHGHRVDVLIQLNALIDARKIANDLATQPDEEARKHERDAPHRDLKEPFRHAQ